jgi:uncharacterized UBP type Zn finger protein
MSKFSGTERCVHVPLHMPVAKPADACATCSTPDNRRYCLTCGQVGCCDSLNGHARAHAHETGHWVMSALPLSRLSFVWCYKCDAYVIGPADHPAAIAQDAVVHAAP